MQGYSDWLYVVPWGLYKALIWTKEKFNNPIMLIGENGKSPSSSALPPLSENEQ